MIDLLTAIDGATAELADRFSDMTSAFSKAYDDSPMGAIENVIQGVDDSVSNSGLHQTFAGGDYGSGSFGSSKFENQAFASQGLPEYDSYVDATKALQTSVSQAGINNPAAMQVTGGLPLLPTAPPMQMAAGAPIMDQLPYGQENLDQLDDIDTPPVLEDKGEDDETAVKTGVLAE